MRLLSNLKECVLIIEYHQGYFLKEDQPFKMVNIYQLFCKISLALEGFKKAKKADLVNEKRPETFTPTTTTTTNSNMKKK